MHIRFTGRAMIDVKIIQSNKTRCAVFPGSWSLCSHGELQQIQDPVHSATILLQFVIHRFLIGSTGFRPPPRQKIVPRLVLISTKQFGQNKHDAPFFPGSQSLYSHRELQQIQDPVQSATNLLYISSWSARLVFGLPQTENNSQACSGQYKGVWTK